MIVDNVHDLLRSPLLQLSIRAPVLDNNLSLALKVPVLDAFFFNFGSIFLASERVDYDMEKTASW